MNKKIIAAAISAAVFSGSVVAASKPMDVNAMRSFLDARPAAVDGQVERIFDNQVAVEFSQPAFTLVGNTVDSLVGTLSKLTGLDFKVNRVMMNRFVVIDLPGAKSDSDVLSAVSRLLSVPGVLEVTPNKLVKPLSVDSFQSPGWKNFQFKFYSSATDGRGDPLKYNPRFLELIHFFEGVNFGGSRLSFVDGFFDSTPNMPHAVYVQTQTVVNGNFSRALADNSRFPAHGLSVAAYIGGQDDPAYGTVGLARRLPLLAIDTYGESGSSSAFDIVEGVLYSVNLHSTAGSNPNPNKASVINLSLSQPNGFQCDSVFQTMVDKVNNSGAIVVAAAGNDGANTINSPANCAKVVSVGAVGVDARMPSYSNKSQGLVTSAISGSSANTLFSTTSRDKAMFNQGAGSFSGTSMSAPYISMLIAYAKSINPGLGFDQAEALLKRNSVPFDSTDPRCGSGACGSVVDPVKFIAEVSGQDLTKFTKYTGQSVTGPTDPTKPTDPVQPPDTSLPPAVSISLDGTASNPGDVVVFENGQPFTVRGVQLSPSNIVIEFGKRGQFVVEFTANPNTNTATPSVSRAKYRASVNTNSNPATVGQIERLTDPTLPDQSQNPAAPPVSGASGGGGGGGSTSLPGVLAMGLLFGIYRRMFKK